MANKPRLITGKCETELSRLARGSVHLLVNDPPYNYDVDYDVCDDDKPVTEYLDWTRKWLTGAVHCLHKHGTLVVFYPDELVSDVDVMIRREFKLHRRSWVVWAFGFGVACQKNFSRSHTHILFYTRSKTRFTFNAAEVRVPSDRQLLYNDRRAAPGGKLPNNVWVLQKTEMEKVLPKDGDTWYVSRICGTYQERQKESPNQIPVPIMERIVLACSNPGDLVCDPCGGSFTAGVACVRHGRDFIGIDVSKNYVEGGRKRIEAERASLSKGGKP